LRGGAALASLAVIAATGVAVAASATVGRGVSTTSASAATASATAAAIAVEDAWLRSARPGQRNAAGYLRVRSSAADRLVGARPPADLAERGELHTMRMDGDVMVMREVDAFDLKPGQPLAFAPGGNHLMLMGLKRPLPAGETVTVVLVFEKAGEVLVRMPVRDAMAAAHGQGKPAAHGKPHN
jgi:copper(I)-binding protein